MILREYVRIETAQILLAITSLAAFKIFLVPYLFRLGKKLRCHIKVNIMDTHCYVRESKSHAYDPFPLLSVRPYCNFVVQSVQFVVVCYVTLSV
jgi:hypothetical protein